MLNKCYGTWDIVKYSFNNKKKCGRNFRDLLDSQQPTGFTRASRDAFWNYLFCQAQARMSKEKTNLSFQSSLGSLLNEQNKVDSCRLQWAEWNQVLQPFQASSTLEKSCMLLVLAHNNFLIH